jgi:hypothetical protein
MSRKIILHAIELDIGPPIEKELLCEILQSHYDAMDRFAKLPHANLGVRDI